jgi:pyrimidine-nucleoside phosphorylase
MLLLGKIADTEDQAHNLAAEAIRSGKAWKAFRELIRAQDGDVEHVVHPEKLPRASFTETVPAPRSGYLKQIHAREIGLTALDLGAGREKKGQPIDHAVGVVVHCKVGDHLEKGDDLVTIHANHQEDIEPARQRLLKAHRWSEEAVEPLPPVYDIVR